MPNKYKILEEDRKQIFLNESPCLPVLSVHNGWHQNSETLAKKVCDWLNDEQSTASDKRIVELIEGRIETLKEMIKADHHNSLINRYNELTDLLKAFKELK